MGLRFRRSVRLFPGVRLNFSRSGVSTSVGMRGASLTIGSRGTYANVGLPGSGLSQRTRLDPPPNPRVRQSAPPRSPASKNGLTPSDSASELRTDNETLIESADVSVLTSAGLGELKHLINEAAIRRAVLRGQLTKAEKGLSQASGRLKLAQSLVVRLFTERAIPRLLDRANKASDAVEETRAQLDGCYVEVDFAFDNAAHGSYAALARSFDALRRAQRIWDITATSAVNQLAERTAASIAVRRVPVTFDLSNSDTIRSKYQALRLGNVGGRDLHLHPGFILMGDQNLDFALIEWSDFECKFSSTRVVEEETPPADAQRDGTTWKKANKDGSRDQRFSDNREIPIMRYGEMAFSSPGGLRELYQVSHHENASEFAQSIAAHKCAVANSVRTPDESDLGVPTKADEPNTEELPPAFVAKPRTYLAIDWTVFALLTVAIGWGGIWTASNWDKVQALLVF